MSSSKAKMFLAEERACDDTEWFRSYHTFNFGMDNNEHKSAFGSLYVLNDDTIAPDHLLTPQIEHPSYVIVLPVVGAVVCKTGNAAGVEVSAGNLQIMYVKEGAQLELWNPFKEDLVNYIQMWIRVEKGIKNDVNRQVYFNLEESRNQLIHMPVATADTGAEVVVSIGKFEGRKNGVYQPQNAFSDVFVFVIEGAFEVQDRLLHARDGVGFWRASAAIDFEALSSDAILLITELGTTSVNN